MHVVGEQAEPGPIPKQDLQERSLLPRNTNRWPENGSFFRSSWTSVARPSKPLRLCGAPHNRNYAERTIMQSPRSLIRDQPCYQQLSAQCPLPGSA